MLIYAAAGGIGNALIDLAKAAELIVIGVISSEEKARFARELQRVPLIVVHSLNA